MLSKEEIWHEVQKLVEAEGLSVFELECPTGNRGVLRVFLCNREGGAKGVGMQECTRVARKINDAPNVEELIPGECTLEVSSPGVNRRLTRPEHFKGARGERVKLSVARTAEEGSPKKEVIRGVVTAADESVPSVTVQRESDKMEETIPLSIIREARIDFVFE